MESNLAINTWIVNPSDFSQMDLYRSNHVKTLNQATVNLPGGVYTTFRTFQNGKILPLDFHIERLIESARLLGFVIQIDEASLIDHIRYIKNQITEYDIRFRITYSLEPGRHTLFISSEPILNDPIEVYDQGIQTITRQHSRNIPRAKASRYIRIIEQIYRELPKEIHEVLLFDHEGNIREGVTSNFFYIRNGVVHTAGKDILEGMTRKYVIKSIQSLQLPLEYSCLPVSEITTIDEAFITSSTRLILPITKIDQQILPESNESSITKKINLELLRVIQDDLIQL